MESPSAHLNPTGRLARNRKFSPTSTPKKSLGRQFSPCYIWQSRSSFGAVLGENVSLDRNEPGLICVWHKPYLAQLSALEFQTHRYHLSVVWRSVVLLERDHHSYGDLLQPNSLCLLATYSSRRNRQAIIITTAMLVQISLFLHNLCLFFSRSIAQSEGSMLYAH
jgi:hypothetical protein